MPTLESLGIDKLTTEEKYELIEAIEASIADEAHDMVRNASRYDILEAVKLADREPEDFVRWESIQKKLDEKFGS
ncbi:MAG: hypothetical protein ACRC8S_00770 [Fimbriiglobus sp.]